MKIIDNKKIDLTEDEWNLYQQICKSYDRPNCKGEELFVDLFETDDYGNIIFLKPPSTRHTSMEVCIFIANIMQHQHIRLMHKNASIIYKKVQDKLDEVEELRAKLEKKLVEI